MKQKIILDVTVEIDENGNFVEDDSITLVKELESDFNVSIKVIFKESPSGWPEIEFSGEKEDLHKFIREWYCANDMSSYNDLLEYFEAV